MLATLSVNLSSDASTITDDGNLRLREAIAYVNGSAIPGPADLARISGPLGQNDAIVFSSNLNGAIITLNPNFGSLVVGKRVNIVGPSNKVTIRPQFAPSVATYGFDYVFANGSSDTMVLSNMIISNFTTGVRVASIPSGSHLIIETSDIGGSTAFGGVGGVGVEVGTNQRVSINLSGVSSNSRYGIYVHDNSSTNLVSIQGNSIGVNTFAGIFFENANRPFNIGGNDIYNTPSGPGIRILNSTHAGNSRIESGNAIFDNVGGGILLTNADFPNLIIQQNFIGIDASGQDGGNGASGIGAVDSEVQAIQLNAIGFNGGDGIFLDETHSVSIASNNIGTDTNVIGNSLDMGNDGQGIALVGGTEDTIIFDNAIAYNDGDGISIVDDTGDGDLGWRNIIFGNGFWENSGLPIDLKNDGATPNDQDDGDNGPNALLNWPEFVQTSLTFNGSVWQVPLRIDVDQLGEYAVEFYKYDPDEKSYLRFAPQSLADPYLVQVTTLTNGPDRTVTIPLTNGIDVVAGEQIVAVLIGNSGTNDFNTSEFSNPLVLDVMPPTITNVTLFGSLWNPSVKYSYASLTPQGNQLKPIYTQGVNRVSITFNEQVTLPANPALALTILGNNRVPISPGITITYGGYDPVTRTATWNLSSALGPGKYALKVEGVKDLAGFGLDGDWTNFDGEDANDHSPDDFTDDRHLPLISGNGQPGGTFEFHFSVLPGDYNQDGVVLSADAVSGTVKDGDGDGVIESGVGGDDKVLAETNVNMQLPLRKSWGDFNDDEIVDVHDYEKWFATYGSTTILDADGNGNGQVDAADYILWRANIAEFSAWWDGTGGGSVEGMPIVDFGNAPRVVNVTISGSNSTHDPYGFVAVAGSGEQLRTVPVGGADTISITFSEDVNVEASYLGLIGLRTANVPTLVEFSYDLGTMTATWRFDDLIANDQYLIALSDDVTDIEGNRLDGEWVNPAALSTTNPAVSEFPSGDGQAGGHFNFVITLIAADANLDNLVDEVDYSIWQTFWAQDGGFLEGDFGGDGIVGPEDLPYWDFTLGISLQSAWVLADLNGDSAVDGADIDLLWGNMGMQDPTQAHGDLDGDNDVDFDDLDLAFAQFGLELAVAS